MFNKKRKKDLIIEKIKNKGHVDFRKIDLSKTKLVGLDLSGIDFTRGRFKKTMFIKCNLANVTFRGADLSSALFEGCNFTNTNLEFSNITSCIFKDCAVKDTDLRNSSGDNALFFKLAMENTLLEGASFMNSKWRECKCNNIKARGSNFENAFLDRSIFKDGDFTFCTFTGSSWKESVFDRNLFISITAHGIEIFKCSFIEVKFFNSDFRNAYLLPLEIRNEVINQDGLVSPQYLKALFLNKYSRIGALSATALFIFFIVQKIINPSFWGIDKIIDRAYKAIDKGRFEKAESLLERGLSRKNISVGEKGHLKLALGDLYNSKCDFEASKDVYGEIMAMKVNEWYSRDAHRNMAELYLREGNLKEAIAVYSKLLEKLSSENLNYLIHTKIRLGNIYADTGDIEKAHTVYDEIINDETLSSYYHSEALLHKANLMRGLNSHDEVLDIYQKALDKTGEKGQKGNILLNMADFYRDSDNLGEAKRLYEKVSELSESDWYSLSARERMAELYRREGNFKKAIDIYRDLLGFIPLKEFERLSWLRINLGDTYFESGDVESAKRTYSEALESAPENTYIVDKIKKRMERFR